MHAYRVYSFARMIARKEHLSDFTELEILRRAAFYHEVGLEDSRLDQHYGRRSWEKIKTLDLLSSLDLQQQQLLHYLMENHCRKDQAALSCLADYRFPEPEQAVLLLSIFKDADALDTTSMFLELPGCLRLESSRELCQRIFPLP